jgi:hypothetical protein
MLRCQSHQKGDTALDVTLAVVADYANVSNDGKLNIMGIFQEVTPAAFPAVVPQMYLVISWEAAPPEFGTQRDVRITFMGPDPDEQYVSLDTQVVVPRPVRAGERAIFNQILDIKGLPILKSGPHALYILLRDDPKAEVRLFVREPTKTEREEEVEESG